MISDSIICNIKELSSQVRQKFDFVRFDPNNECNLHYVYCHNHRVRSIVHTAAFRASSECHGSSGDTFQVGSFIEPMLTNDYPIPCSFVTEPQVKLLSDKQIFLCDTDTRCSSLWDRKVPRIHRCDGTIRHLKIFWMCPVG